MKMYLFSGIGKRMWRKDRNKVNDQMTINIL